MASKQESKLQQANFLARYLAHGDAKKAYVEAGYEGDATLGSYQLLRRPSVMAWLNETGEAVAQVAIETVKEQTRDVLQTRDGLSDWLVGVVRGEETQTHITQDGEEIQVAAGMKERLKAAELLAKIQGMMTQKIEVDHRAAVFHFTTVDNGRGGELPGEIVVDDGEA